MRAPLQEILDRAASGPAASAPPSLEMANVCLEAIERSASRVLDLLDGLLDASRLEHDTSVLSAKRIDPLPLIARVVAELEPQARAKNVALNLQPMQPLPDIVADPVRIDQMMRTLLANAIHHSPEGGTVSIKVLPADGPALDLDAGRKVLRIIVRDQGYGIAPDQLASLFDKFAPGARTRSGPDDMGLGLSICRRTVELHEGRINASNNVEGGASFEVLLPAAQ